MVLKDITNVTLVVNITKTEGFPKLSDGMRESVVRSGPTRVFKFCVNALGTRIYISETDNQFSWRFKNDLTFAAYASGSSRKVMCELCSNT